MLATETEPEVKRAVPPWRRMLVAAGWFALLLVAVSAAVYVFNRHWLTSQLDRVLMELDESDPGWRWPGPYQDRPTIPLEENSVPRILAIVNAFPRGWPDSRTRATIWHRQPNLALNGPRRKMLDDLLAADPVPRLRVEARGLVRYPRGQLDRTVTENPLAMLPGHDKLYEAARLLELDAHAMSLDGQHGEALKSARACLNVSRALEDDPTLPGQLVRLQAAAAALRMAEQTMALGDAPGEALAAFQQEIEHEAGRTGMTAALRGERAALHQLLTLLVAGKVTLGEIEALRRGNGRRPAPVGWLASLADREMARREHAGILRQVTKLVEASKLPAREQLDTEARFDELLRSPSCGEVMRVVVPAINRTCETARGVQSYAVAMRALIAVERYRLKHGKWPARLDDMVPDFLDKVPLDPMDEKPIRYARWADGVVVYSIGLNRKDDGGGVGGPGVSDFGYRLWDKEQRRAALP